MTRPNAADSPRDLRQASATGGWLGRYWGTHPADFVKREDGNMSYVALVGSLIMMIFGGIGIDMMHAELKRTKIQHTLDRATLAAASLENHRDAEQVVQDYFRAMHMQEDLTSVTVEQSLGHKRVSADGAGQISSDFLGLIGVDTLAVAGHATAQNALADTEISMVLDVSGSMGGAKLQQLKDAAHSFIDTIMPVGGDNSRVTISIVPYNATVNMGPTLAEHFSLEDLHGFSACAYFDASDFSETAITPTQPLSQLGAFDPDGSHVAATEKTWCPTGTLSAIVPHSADPEALKAFIDSLEARGNTAIDLGMKWGLALLDPAARPIMADLAAEGIVSTSAAARPANFDDHETMKFVVVMTDGANTQQYDLRDELKAPDAMSPVWVDDNGTTDRSDDRYSILVQDNPGLGNDVYLWADDLGTDGFHSGVQSWALGELNDPDVDALALVSGTGTTGNGPAELSQAWPNANCDASFQNCDDPYDLLAACSTYTGGVARNGLGFRHEELLTEVECADSAPVQLTWMELYAHVKTTTFANTWIWQLYQNGYVSYQDYYNAFYAWETKVDDATADGRLSTICNAARDQSVVIYAIGVEAPQRGLDAMADCASSPSHFFDVQGNELVATFEAISDVLTKLRLTQ